MDTLPDAFPTLQEHKSVELLTSFARLAGDTKDILVQVIEPRIAQAVS